MIVGELAIGGVYVPSLLLAALVAADLSLGLRALLARAGFYALVWHRALVDLSLYVILLAVVIQIGRRLPM